MKVVLLRHGRTAWTGLRYCGTNDPPLTREGSVEVKVAADRIAVLGLALPVVLASPMQRTRQTAGMVAASLGVAVECDGRLREVDFGEAEGLTFSEVAARWPSLANAMSRSLGDIDWPGGERAAALHERTQAFWDERVEPAGRDLVIVSHGATLDALVRHASGSGLPLLGPAAFHVLVREQTWRVIP